jgi:filamentous hemagglutinin family protein
MNLFKVPGCIGQIYYFSCLDLRLGTRIQKYRWGFSGSVLGVVALFLGGNPVDALPTDGNVVRGQAEIQQLNPQQLNIQQTSDRAVINWQSFSVGAQEAVHFQQPSTTSATLNRVTGNTRSEIAGRITANGQVMLVNPNGILFTPSAKVDVGGMLATTLDIQDQDFMSGNLNFQQVPGKPPRTVENQGQITVHEGGYAALVAPGVVNSGVINVKMGKVVLASGTQATLDFYGDGLLSLAVDPNLSEQIKDANGQPLSALVNQSGTINADGGTVTLSAKAGAAVVDNVINLSGVVQARSISNQNGTIVLSGGESGMVSVSGTLDVSGVNSGETGGTVQVLGEKVGLMDGAKVNVSGDAGGGTVLFGGDYQGQGTVPNAHFAYIAPNATIHADALTKGNGGKVIVWSEQATRFYGTITAQGGPQEGDGGLVETSGKAFLESLGTVDASAANGTSGIWLLDPRNVIITSNGPFSSFTNPFEPTTDDARVNVAQINAALNGGTSVTITTGSTGTQAGNITVESSIDKTGGGGDATLVLSAANDITINSGVSIKSTGNNRLNMVFTADSDNSGSGNFVVSSGTGGLDTNTGNLTINAVNIVLNGTGGITAGTGGNVNLTATGAITASTGVEVTGTNLTINAAQGITLNTRTANLTLNNSTSGNVQINEATSLNVIGRNDAPGGAVNIAVGTDNPDDFTLTVTGLLTSANGDITLRANRMNLDANANSSVNAGSAIVTLQPFTTEQLIDLGGSDSATQLGLTNSELNRVSAGTLRIGNSTGANIRMTSAIAPTNTPTLSLQTSGTITQNPGAPLTVTNLAFRAGGAVDLSNVLNNVTTLSGSTTGAIQYVDANNLTIGTVDQTTGLTTANSAFVRSLGGNLTLNVPVAANGTGTAIVLVADNNFTNTAGAAALHAPNGRFLVYSTDPAFDQKGGLTGAEQFSSPYPTPPSFTGNGFLYKIATPTPPTLPPPTLPPPSTPTPVPTPEPELTQPDIDPILGLLEGAKPASSASKKSSTPASLVEFDEKKFFAANTPSPDPAEYVRQGLAAFCEGDRQSATELLQKGADLYQQQGNSDQSRQVLQLIKRVNPSPQPEQVNQPTQPAAIPIGSLCTSPNR